MSNKQADAPRRDKPPSRCANPECPGKPLLGERWCEDCWARRMARYGHFHYSVFYSPARRKVRASHDL